jgi:2-polyprenyl-6-methoxyphenol hydroxylase-like FAD-dependent oxidoreductase
MGGHAGWFNWRPSADQPAAALRGHEALPRGYLVIGDAICSFNPLCGQGMSVAATEAKALDDSLAAGLDGLAARFYAKASAIVDIPWLIATGEDLRYPQVEGTRPPGSSLTPAVMLRVLARRAPQGAGTPWGVFTPPQLASQV